MMGRGRGMRGRGLTKGGEFRGKKLLFFFVTKENVWPLEDLAIFLPNSVFSSGEYGARFQITDFNRVANHLLYLIGGR